MSYPYNYGSNPLISTSTLSTQVPRQNPDSLITPILPISYLGLQEITLSTISAYFSGYREIKSTNDSVGLSFILSLIDSAIHFKNTEKILMIKSLFEKYLHEMPLGNQQNQKYLIDQVIMIINREDLSAGQKLETFQSYLDYYNSDFFFLYRNCMNAISKLFYYDVKDEYEMIRFTLTFDELKQITSNDGAPFPKQILMYFSEFFKTRLCIINERTFEIEQLGSQLYKTIYVLDINERYYPLSSNFEERLRTLATSSEYIETIRFIDESNRKKYENETLNDLDRKIQEQKRKLAESQDVYLKLLTNMEVEPAFVQNCLGGNLQFEHEKLLNLIVCNSCSSISRNYELECKHRICVNCYARFGYANPIACPTCNVTCYRVDAR
jgi:hypothetical protein